MEMLSQDWRDRVHQARLRSWDVGLFRGVLQDEVGQAFLQLLSLLDAGGPAQEVAETYTKLFRLLAAETNAKPGPVVGDAWQEHLLDRLLEDENPFSHALAHASLDELGPSLVEQARVELQALQALFRMDARSVHEAASAVVAAEVGWAPRWQPWERVHLQGSVASAAGPKGEETDPAPSVEEHPEVGALRARVAQAHDWGACLEDLAAFYRRWGVGLFARYRAFRWVPGAGGGDLQGIAHPDPVRLDDLVGYDEERSPLIANTEQFVAGLPANNALLYGDRGTGKSSTVKALLNAYADRGLRLVEIAKQHLDDLPQLLQRLRGRRERFILFVDDLSFEEHETYYKELKSVLEGGLEVRPDNVVVYATSNRRHLVREYFSDRDGAVDGEVHRRDTMEEKLSLSDRFGLRVVFVAPDQERYLAIVRAVARQHGIAVDAALERQALAWAGRHNGLSGRTARQFVVSLLGRIATPLRP
jgi:predicted AAA+ superfamily ATPase